MIVALPAHVPGLSPRVRGNHAKSDYTFQRWGPIPARAGEPLHRLLIPTCGGAYPRACGGTDFDAYHDAPASGLSPRVRGNRA